MRKISLLAAAAMVAGGSVFAMDGGGVSISGEANFGVKFAESDDDSKSELQFHHEFDVKFSASGTTDGGIGFGGSMSIDNTESVTSGKVTPAKTGYIVTSADLTDSGKKALEAKYGLTMAQVNALSEHDVIESGVATSFSGYGFVEIPGHTNTRTNSQSYSAGDGADEFFAMVAATTTDDERGTTENTFNFEEGTTVKLGGKDYTVTRAVTSGADEVGTGAILTLTLGDAPNGANTITLTYAEDADGKTVAAVNGVDANEGWIIAGSGYIPGDRNYVLLSDDIVATAMAAVELTGQERLKVSQAYIDDLSASVAASDKQKVDNHGEVYISMDMHKLTIGSDLDAADKVAGGLADPGFDGIGIDDEAERVWGKSAADVRYDGDFGVASVAISYGDNKGDAEWAAGFSFNVEPVTFGAGFDSNGVMSVGMGFSQGAIAMNALYSTDSDHDEADNEGFKCEDVAPGKAGYKAASHAACTANLISKETWNNKPDLKNQAFGVDVSYQMSEATLVVLVAAQHKEESAHISYNRDAKAVAPATGGTPASYSWSTTSTTVDAFGVGFSHDLGGGATLKAGAGSVDSEAKADLGITMTF